MLLTSKKAVEAIRKNSSSDFKALIGMSLADISKNDELLQFDVQQISSLFLRYLKDKEIEYKITGLLNSQSQMAVSIPIFDRVVDSAGIKEMHLNLLFGPPNFVSLDKISGYKLIRNRSDSSEFSKQ